MVLLVVGKGLGLGLGAEYSRSMPVFREVWMKIEAGFSYDNSVEWSEKMSGVGFSA